MVAFVKRRLLLLCTIGVAFLLFSSFHASAADKTVGVIMTGNIPYYQEMHKAFVDGMNRAGQNIDIVLQTPASEPMAWTNAARKLVSLGTDVIISYGTPSMLMVMKETSDIPLVFAGVYDPDAAGIKGKNITGINSKVPVATLVKHMKDITNFTKVGIVYNSNEKDTALQANDIKNLEGKYGFQSTFLNADKKGEAEKIATVNALVLTTSCAAVTCVENYLGVAKRNKIPAAALIGGLEERGIILTLSADPAEQGAETAKKVIEILKGTKPASLPVTSPSKVNLIVNLKEATRAGLQVPIDILTSATKVIK